MKTTSMLALIAVISAVSIGTITLNGFSAIPLVAASVSPESGTFMGHVEYILRDSDGNIKSYVQGDNLVVNKGDDCVIGYAFQTGITSDNCTLSSTGFRYIGVGNGSSTAVVNGDTTLDQTTQAVATTSTDGLMAMKLDTDTVGTASASGGTVVIATETPFVFTAGTNTTTVTGAGLFDGTCTMTNGVCTAYGTPNMFSAQRINVAVAGGDSLSVTWTITVGNAS